nr:TatD family hydrolase [Bacillus sp. FJAT-49736]
MHLSNIKEFRHTAKELSFVDYSNKGIVNEYREAGVVLGIGMGLTETAGLGFPDPEAQTPMALDLEEQLPDNIVYCAGINPYTLDENAIERLEYEIQKPNVVGMKIYLGYYPFYAFDQVYDPVYSLAEKYDIPVVFHTGDTYSERGLLKYSHPLTLDEVAVKHRKIRFMMAHFGDPWVLTGSEVVYKNSNMYADLSGLLVGTEKEFKNKLNGRFFDHLKHALEFCDHYEKLLFGTDWPLAPIATYIDFVKEIIPEKFHSDVFYHNALKVFPKINSYL